MNRLTLILLLTALILSCERNTAPVIDSLIAEPDSVYPGDTVTLTYETSDADGDAILYLFSKSSGTWITVIGTGQPTRWIAPKVPGDYYLTLTITDLTDKVADSVMIHVMDTTGVFTDSRDEHQYKWVKIGKQIWMAENLAYLPAVSSWDTGVDTAGFYYVYGYEGTDVAEAKMLYDFPVYGALYSWKAAGTACPSGWRLPSDNDWKNLEISLGMSESDANALWIRNSGMVGKKMKSMYDWDSTGNGDNSSRFDCFPGGMRDNGRGFISKGTSAYFWTSTQDSFTGYILGRWLSCHEDGVYRVSLFRWRGTSVRCVKDK